MQKQPAVETSLRRIALIHRQDTLVEPARVAALVAMLDQAGVEHRAFSDFAALMDAGYAPDCVLALSPQEAKLGPYPTYGVVELSPQKLFSHKRLIRNLLTYDGCVSLSPFVQDIIGDLYFSARKFGGAIGTFGGTPPVRGKREVDFRRATLAAVLLPGQSAVLRPLYAALKKSGGGVLYRFADGPAWAGASTLDYNAEAILDAYAACGIGLELYGCDEVNRQLSAGLCYILASGTLAITNRSDVLYERFGDSLLYLSPGLSAREAVAAVQAHLAWARAHPAEAQKKAHAAQAIYQRHFGAEKLISALARLHGETLARQGYLPPPGNVAQDLPWVSYIMRTGGDAPYLAAALESLSAQSYPHIQVILVLYKPLPALDALIEVHRHRLHFKLVEDYGQLRSTGIVNGMRAVDTEYFGLLDDDDALHANHVQSLINTLHYHDRRDWRGEIRLAYCGSYCISDTLTFSEDAEWYDAHLSSARARRAVEHFRFYDADKMASHAWCMMSNAWLAHKSLIDDELLVDPRTHTHEDLYFEQQFALRTHFAFSVEMTSLHRFHGANSTLVDMARHEADLFRHRVRLQYRSFPCDRFARPEGRNGGCIAPLPIPSPSPPAYLRQWLARPRQNARQGMKLARSFARHIRAEGPRVATRRALWWVQRRI